jgi:5-methylcytosine-specific restriction endonuclease McrA
MARSAAGACTARAKCKESRLPHAAVCATHWFGIAAKSCGLPSGESSTLMLKSLWETQGGTCALTGMPLAIGDNASIDHILPTSRGGTNDLDNLRFVLRVANTMKSDRTDDELVKMCEAMLATLRPRQMRKLG